MHIPMHDDFVSAYTHAAAEHTLDIPAALKICSYSATYGKIVTNIKDEIDVATYNNQ